MLTSGDVQSFPILLQAPGTTGAWTLFGSSSPSSSRRWVSRSRSVSEEPSGSTCCSRSWGSSLASFTRSTSSSAGKTRTGSGCRIPLCGVPAKRNPEQPGILLVRRPRLSQLPPSYPQAQGRRSRRRNGMAVAKAPAPRASISHDSSPDPRSDSRGARTRPAAANPTSSATPSTNTSPDTDLASANLDEASFEG